MRQSNVSRSEIEQQALSNATSNQSTMNYRGFPSAGKVRLRATEMPAPVADASPETLDASRAPVGTGLFEQYQSGPKLSSSSNLEPFGTVAVGSCAEITARQRLLSRLLLDYWQTIDVRVGFCSCQGNNCRDGRVYKPCAGETGNRLDDSDRFGVRHIFTFLRFAQFVGLEKPRKILSNFAKKPYPSAWLFTGPSGVGKTSMAQALALEIRGELHHIPSQKCDAKAIDETCAFCHYVPLGGGMHVILVDEADRMTPGAQLALLSKLDATAFPPNTVFIFTCNDTKGLEPRFLSRCRVLEFSSYGMAAAIAEYLDKVWHAEGGNGNCPDLARIVKDSRNNVRDSLMQLETALLEL